jgi:CBS domain-containing protein
MRIEQIMVRPVQSCRAEDSLARAAQLMWDHDCGCLPVCSGNGIERVVGVITDRDICMCALFEGKPLGALRVGQAMAKEPRLCRPGDSPADAERTMRDARIRRLPVVDEAGALVGMVSLADLAHEASRERSGTRGDVSEIELASTLAAICEPQHRQLAPRERRRESSRQQPLGAS